MLFILDISAHASRSFSIGGSTQVAGSCGQYQRAPLLSGFQYVWANGRPCQETGGQEGNEVEMFLLSASPLPGSGSAVAGLSDPTPPLLYWVAFLRAAAAAPQDLMSVPPVAPFGPGIDRVPAVATPQLLNHLCHFPFPAVAFVKIPFLNSPRLPH